MPPSDEDTLEGFVEASEIGPGWVQQEVIINKNIKKSIIESINFS